MSTSIVYRVAKTRALLREECRKSIPLFDPLNAIQECTVCSVYLVSKTLNVSRLDVLVKTTSTTTTTKNVEKKRRRKRRKKKSKSCTRKTSHDIKAGSEQVVALVACNLLRITPGKVHLSAVRKVAYIYKYKDDVRLGSLIHHHDAERAALIRFVASELVICVVLRLSYR